MDRYRKLGVSATKEDVSFATRVFSKGLFPNSFCHIVEDILGGDENYCVALHADGSGTKSALAYVYYRETGDAGVFAGVAKDSLFMNTDDLMCSGFVDNFLVSNVINRNAHVIDREVLHHILLGYDEAVKDLCEEGITIRNAGGETADVGDLTGTVVIDSTVVARQSRTDVISNDIVPGLDIVGIPSYGTCSYDDEDNTGVASNGFTLLRHALLANEYAQKYPETFSRSLGPDAAYAGPFRLTDCFPGTNLEVGRGLLSPTRTFLPVMRDVYRHCGRNKVKGVVHCTGGGLFKSANFGRGVRYVKDNLFALPTVYEYLLTNGVITFAEACKVLNMGVRVEIYCDPADTGEIIHTIGKRGITAKRIGHTAKADTSGNRVVVSQGENRAEFSK